MVRGLDEGTLAEGTQRDGERKRGVPRGGWGGFYFWVLLMEDRGYAIERLLWYRAEGRRRRWMDGSNRVD